MKGVEHERTLARLADQLFEALSILLVEFDEAGQDPRYGDLLAVVLRLVFVVQAEDRGLVTSLGQRFDAYPRLRATLRAVFDAERLGDHELEVELLGGLYEALMGYQVRRIPREGGPAVCLRRARVWVTVDELMAVTKGQRVKWLLDRGLSRAQATKLDDSLSAAKTDDARLEALLGAAVKGVSVAAAGRLVIQPGRDRRRTGSHYSPRSLAEPIVARTLEPVIAAMDGAGEPRAEQLLSLKVCDPAMGSGVFLLAALRFLAQQVVAAWTREGSLAEIAARHGDPGVHARRLVAKRCIHGVDKNPVAVELAKLSLWLETGAGDEPLSFVDHALRCGDSLVGLDLDALAVHEQIQPTLQRSRVIGDCLVGAFFAADKDKARRTELAERRALLEAWIAAGPDAPTPAKVQQWAAEIRRQVQPFHWALEFPAGFDAVVGNPPFMGQAHMSGNLGSAYRDWLYALHPECRGKSDLVVHFLRRASHLLDANGAIGLITSNTIAQGDTRVGGLAWLVQRGHLIYAAEPALPWPGAAVVTVSIVHLARGRAAEYVQPRLGASEVACINSRLEARPERAEALRLAANRNNSFIGCKIGGQGFLLTPEERAAIVAQSPASAERIFEYVGGSDVNMNPRQRSTRHVIDFGQLSLDQAEQWPLLLQWVRDRVKPYRDSVRRASWRKRWWQFAEVYPKMRAAIAPLERFLVTSAVTKHLCFSFQTPDRIPSHKLYVFPLSDYFHFACMQSRVHEIWARALSSTLGTALNYSGSDCFETFAFPVDEPDQRAAVEQIGERLYVARAQYMLDTDQGLTKTYNALSDPEIVEGRVVELRELHVDMDRAVLAAYGWFDIEVPAYTDPRRAFKDEVLDRLFALNAKRAAAQTSKSGRPVGSK